MVLTIALSLLLTIQILTGGATPSYRHEISDHRYDFAPDSDGEDTAIVVNTANSHWQQPYYAHQEIDSLTSQMRHGLELEERSKSQGRHEGSSSEPYFWNDFSDADALSELPEDFDFQAEVLDLTGRPQRTLEEDLADKEYCERLYEYVMSKEGDNLPYKRFIERLRNHEPRILRHRAVFWKNHESDPETQVEWSLEEELADPDQFDKLWMFARTKMGSNLPRQSWRDRLLAGDSRATLIRKIFWRKERLSRGLPVIWSVEEELEDYDQFERVYAFASTRARLSRTEWAQRLRSECPWAMQIREEYYGR